MALFGRRVRIGDLLVSQGLITEKQLETALEEQKIRKLIRKFKLTVDSNMNLW